VLVTHFVSLQQGIKIPRIVLVEEIMSFHPNDGSRYAALQKRCLKIGVSHDSNIDDSLKSAKKKMFSETKAYCDFLA